MVLSLKRVAIQLNIHGQVKMEAILMEHSLIVLTNVPFKWCCKIKRSLLDLFFVLYDLL